MLQARLEHLVQAGILERRRYQDSPAGYEYRLTDAGRDLWPVVVSLLQWGDTHAAREQGPPVRLKHKGCGGGGTATGCAPAAARRWSTRTSSRGPGAGLRATIRCCAGKRRAPAPDRRTAARGRTAYGSVRTAARIAAMISTVLSAATLRCPRTL